MKYIKRIISLFTVSVILFTLFSVTAVSESENNKMTNLVVCVRFKDDTEDRFAQDTDKILMLYNDTTNLYPLYNYDYSFKAYINEISRGKLNVKNVFPQLENGVIATLTLSSEQRYCNDTIVLKQVIDAFNDGRISLPSDKLDYRTTGIVDNLTVLLQGNADSTADGMMWPHKSICDVPTKICGKYNIGNYNFINTYSLLDSVTMQGTVSHEFLHSVGLPDLYRTNGRTGVPVGAWDIMASDSMYQQYPLSYQRYKMGWVPMQTISSDGDYTLDRVTDKTSDRILYKLETPMSSSEFFMLEYRYLDPNLTYTDSRKFEARIPSSGLVIYRVNNGIEHQTNALGEDYIYVFRPDETSLTGSQGNIRAAAVNPSEGETSYGSADLNAPFTDDTIFYSDGSNSGIVISNISMSADGSKLSFHVDFPDYTGLELWEPVGSSLSTSGTNETFGTVDDNGKMYVLSIASSIARVYTFNDNSWITAAPAISGVQEGYIKAFNNELYFIYINNSGYPVIAKIQNGAWKTIATDKTAQYPNSPQLFMSESRLYCGWVKDGTTLVINQVNETSLTNINSSLTAQYFSNPALTASGNSIYSIYSDFFGADHTTKLKKLDIATGKWENIVIPNPQSYTNVHRAACNNGELWFLSAGYDTAPTVISVKADGTVVQKNVTTTITNFLYIGIDVNKNGTLYVGLFSSDKSSEVIYLENGSWKKLGSNPCDSIQAADMFVYEDRAYVASASINSGTLIVRTKEMPVLPTAQLISKEGTNIKIRENYITGVPLNAVSLSLYLDVTENGYFTVNGTSTGSELYLYSADGVMLKKHIIIANGDINADMSIDGMDAVLISAVIGGMSGLTEIQISAADYNNDFITDSSDYNSAVEEGIFSYKINS